MRKKHDFFGVLNVSQLSHTPFLISCQAVGMRWMWDLGEYIQKINHNSPATLPPPPLFLL